MVLDQLSISGCEARSREHCSLSLFGKVLSPHPKSSSLSFTSPLSTISSPPSPSSSSPSSSPGDKSWAPCPHMETWHSSSHRWSWCWNYVSRSLCHLCWWCDDDGQILAKTWLSVLNHSWWEFRNHNGYKSTLQTWSVEPCYWLIDQKNVGWISKSWTNYLCDVFFLAAVKKGAFIWMNKYGMAANPHIDHM